MFKKFKSLLVAGVMVLGMTGVAFAGNGNDGCYLGEANGCVSEHKNSNEHKVSNITETQWKAYVDAYNKANLAYKIVLQSENNGNGWHTWKIMKGEEQVEVVHVKYNKELTEEEEAAKQPPTTPEIPGEEPPTGDASIMPIVATAAISVAGLFLLNKKDDEE